MHPRKFIMSQVVAATVTLLLAVRSTVCVPTHSMEMERFRNSIDLDAEQTEARYDQEMLSDIMKDNDRGELQKAESCLVDDYKYDHGQKIQRLDPCEICLCIDGEIFCWWKQCDAQTKTGHDADQDVPADGQPVESSTTAPFVYRSKGFSNTSPSPATFGEGTMDGTTRVIATDTLSNGVTTAIGSTVAISTPVPNSEDGALPLDTSTRHGEVVDGIPKSMLTFPQTPPIMMYRPGTIGSAKEGKATEAGRKFKPGARKPKGRKLKDQTKVQKLFAVNRKPTVAIASDALARGSDSGTLRTSSDRFRERSESSSKENDPSVVKQPDSPMGASELPEEFGGYGYGMIRETDPPRGHPEVGHGHDRDVPQHYIITSSGHVEMFDDSGTIGGPEVGTELQEPAGHDRDVLSFDGRVSSVVPKDASDEDEEDSGAEDGVVAPAIMLTTNVTQGGGSRSPSSTAAPSSVIDIINSTTLETDYGEGTNHSELIYPEVSGVYVRTVDFGSTTRSPTVEHCVVMGVTYPVGAVLKQETGNCLQCVCVAGPENDPSPRVTCTPLNCPPLILPDILDGAGF
ncbi:uncharacterized protein LOC131216016 [Anopheles bellator]|uniref:uncharacterized protein LOC131216016 n=1 Tax=Anopheles bellator TaxID=139047 RepID=UPI0026476B7E|nr:uncharacterized protein LOC131216016 [Anopheles bellator]